MEVIPAIDLRDGNCVRLYQGDFQRQEIFSENPIDQARKWQCEGATCIHVVDLDGAASGRPANLDTIKNIIKSVDIPIQVGGGIRSISTVQIMIELGVKRVVLGTGAVEDPAFITQIVSQFGEDSIIVSVDAKFGWVAVWGWKKQSRIQVLHHLDRMTDLGVKRFLYTDIMRDGTLTEPNFASIAQVVEHTGLPIQASGGIAKIEHLLQLAQMGAESAIVGRALYSGAFSLSDAIREIDMAAPYRRGEH
ncbi:1-(5-phosphoribosyl)-5-[(5-phosphoribosylamino)methylideneamino]imidazole-4-carboxamide isomerase [SAR202 cluster bacterium AD-802-E10_MRT_200m]|nr:1-(5-phosphoribosyl)-5-[(5-phosphoribosylamino)methylideneamino]imidazole-4-carboxamide isomerase [SAR202 cluster bacterium AD-802-E10_MRT_200m]